MDIPDNIMKNISTSLQTDRPNSASGTQEYRHRLWEAQDFARRGLYAQAELILDEISETDECRTFLLDLRAKILAQQGRYFEAEKCWLKAVSLDPGKQAFRESLDYLARNRQRPIVSLLKYTLIAAIAFCFLLIVIASRSQPEQGRFNESALLKLNIIEQKVKDVQGEVKKTTMDLEDKYKQIFKLQEKDFFDAENRYVHEIEYLKGKIHKPENIPNKSSNKD